MSIPELQSESHVSILLQCVKNSANTVCCMCNLDLFDYYVCPEFADLDLDDKKPITEHLFRVLDVAGKRDITDVDAYFVSATPLYNPPSVFKPRVRTRNSGSLETGTLTMKLFYALVRQVVSVILMPYKPHAHLCDRHNNIIQSTERYIRWKFARGGRAPTLDYPMYSTSDLLHKEVGELRYSGLPSLESSTLKTASDVHPHASIPSVAPTKYLRVRLADSFALIEYLYRSQTMRRVYDKWRNDVIQLADRLGLGDTHAALRVHFVGTQSDTIRDLTLCLLPAEYFRDKRGANVIPPQPVLGMLYQNREASMSM